MTNFSSFGMEAPLSARTPANSMWANIRTAAGEEATSDDYRIENSLAAIWQTTPTPIMP